MKALVTGANSGIGEQIALDLAEDNYDLIAVGRDTKRLQNLKDDVRVDVQTIVTDLSHRDECFDLYQQIKNEDIQIVINCAGFGVFGAFAETDLGSELNMLDVNIESVHILTKLFVKDFMKKNYGYILNVASSAGFMPGPLFASYYASKAYVVRLTVAIHEELRRMKSRVYVGALCPGPVATAFDARAGIKESLRGLSAKEVADYAIRKMYARKTIIVPGFSIKLARFGSKILPDSLMARFAWKQQNKKRG